MEIRKISFLYLKLLLLSGLLTVILLVLLAFLLLKTSLPVSTLNVLLHGIYLLTGLLGGWFAGRAMKRRRFIWGMLFGLVYFLTVFLVSIVTGAAMYQNMTHLFLVLSLCLGGATAGAVFS